MPSDEEFSTSQNPYAAPKVAPSSVPAASSENDEERHLQAFVGSNSDYYLGKWWHLIGGGTGNAGFNWAAFILCGFWLGYRKMYRVAFIFFAIILVETIAEELLFVGLLGRETPEVFGSAVSLAIAVICGANANRWYLSHARNAIADVRMETIDEQAVVQTLSKRGGTNVFAAIGLFLLYVLAAFVSFLILEFFFYPEEFMLDAAI